MYKRLLAAALTPILLMSGIGLGAAQAQSPQNSPTPISACTTLGAAGSYVVTNDLPGSALGCIDITAANVTLDLGGHTLAGDGQGNGVGVRVFAGALNARIANGTINGFAYGIFADAPYTQIYRLTVSNSASGGILLTHATNSQIDGSYISNSGMYGISLADSHGASVTNTRLFSDGVYGVWLNGASNSFLARNQIGPAGNAGIYLGCSPNAAFLAANCAANTHNDIVFNTIDAGQGIGIALSLQASDSLITNNTVTNGLYSAFDSDASCGSNVWRDNHFATPNAACID
jgi:parallel beta-helix repeat protein